MLMIMQFSLSVHSVVNVGLDRHVWDVRPAVFDEALLLGWLSMMFFVISMSAIKASVLLFFLRLIDNRHSRTLYYTVIAGIVLIALAGTAFIFVLIFSCQPISAVYRGMDPKWLTEYRCINREPSDLFNGIFNICTDIYSIILPVLVVRGLSMDRKRKIVLYVIFCCSLIVVVASIVRTIYGKRIYRDARADLTCKYSPCLQLREGFADMTGVGYNLFVWSSLELHLALICASAPAIKGFISAMKQVMQTKGSRTDGSSGHTPTSRALRKAPGPEPRKNEMETESMQLIVPCNSPSHSYHARPT